VRELIAAVYLTTDWRFLPATDSSNGFEIPVLQNRIYLTGVPMATETTVVNTTLEPVTPGATVQRCFGLANLYADLTSRYPTLIYFKTSYT